MNPEMHRFGRDMEKPPTWLGIYQALMSYEPVNWLGFDAL